MIAPGCDPRIFLATPRPRPVTTLRRLFPSLAAAAAVLLFLGITAPAAHAQQLVTYFNFNDTDEISDAGQTSTITQNNLTPSFVPGTPINQRDTLPLDGGQALRLTFPNNGGGNPKTFQFTVSTAGLTNLSLTYATRSSVAVTQTLSYSTNGGTTFTTFVGGSGNTLLPSTSFSLVTFNLGTAAEDQASVIFRITISSAATNHRETNDFDNIQLTGSAVPEPATVVGGLLGALGLCWHQRRRLLGTAQRLRLFRKPAAV